MITRLYTFPRRSNLLSRLSIDHLWILSVLVGIFFFVNTHPIRPHDFWWHAAVGREILATGEIPTIDEYSYTMAGQPYPSYRSFWLMEIALYSVYSWGGPALVVFVQGVLITLAYGILLWLSLQVSGSRRTAAIGVLFAAALGFNDWNVRPQAITFLLGSLYLVAIHAYRTTRKTAWLVVFPLGMMVWVNSHGTFPIGLALLGLWLGDELWEVWKSRTRMWKTKSLRNLLAPAIALGVTSLACLANPSGLGILNYLRTITGDPVVQNLVPEWAPPTFSTLHGAVFLIGLLLSVVVLVLSPRRPGFFELASFLVFAGLSLKTSRGIVWFGLVAAPILANQLAYLPSLQAKADRRSDGSPFVNASILALLTAMAVLSLPWFKESLPWRGVKAGLVSGETPVAATRYLLEHRPTGRLFNAMSFGSYLIWAAQPDYPVFADTRIELYPQEIWMDYLQISYAFPGWEQQMVSYRVNTLMLSPTEQGLLVAAARASPDWEQVYQDDAAIVFVRRNP